MNPLSPILAFIPGSPGPQELIVLFLVILILFGPKRLPEIARTIGKTLDQLRRGADDFKDQVMKLDDDQDDDISSSVDDAYITPDDDDYIDAEADIEDDSTVASKKKDKGNDDVV